MAEAPSLREAVDASCRNCVAAVTCGDWREDVTVCGFTDCPLWKVRPIVPNAPAWLESHDTSTLPANWPPDVHDDALASLWRHMALLEDDEDQDGPE